jgi:hypothetical protein
MAAEKNMTHAYPQTRSISIPSDTGPTTGAHNAVRATDEVVARNPAPDASPPMSPPSTYRKVVICR